MLTYECLSMHECSTVFCYLHEDDSQVLDFPDHVTTETRSTMEMWWEHFVPVAEELLYKITSSDLISL